MNEIHKGIDNRKEWIEKRVVFFTVGISTVAFCGKKQELHHC